MPAACRRIAAASPPKPEPMMAARTPRPGRDRSDIGSLQSGHFSAQKFQRIAGNYVLLQLLEAARKLRVNRAIGRVTQVPAHRLGQRFGMQSVLFHLAGLMLEA